MSGKKPTRYILNSSGEPVAEPDLMAWATAYELSDRRVAKDDVGEFWVSTVFLGLDHNWDDDGPPVLWETMVFLKDHEGIRYGEDIVMDRCSGTREQALAMHAAMVERVASIPVIKEPSNDCLAKALDETKKKYGEVIADIVRMMIAESMKRLTLAGIEAKESSKTHVILCAWMETIARWNEQIDELVRK